MGSGNANSQMQTQPFGLQDQQTSNVQQGVPLAYVAGTRRVAATWLSAVYNLRGVQAAGMSGKKGGSSGALSYNYYGTVAGAICAGPVDALLAILVNGQQVWPGGTAWVEDIAVTTGQAYIYDGQTWIAQQDHVTSPDNAPGNAAFWTEYALARGSENFDDISVSSNGQSYGTLTFYWGAPGQTVDANLVAAGNDHAEGHPSYVGVCYCVLKQWYLGQGTMSAPDLEVVVRRAPRQTLIEGTAMGLTDGQANLAAVLAEVLTDQNMLGQPNALLDAVPFQAAADALESETGLTAGSVLLDAQDTFRSFSDKVQQMTDNWLRFNAATGLIQCGVYKHGQTPAIYTTITAMDLTERPKLTAQGWSEAKSRMVVTYKDRALCYADNSDRYDDARTFFVLGEHRSDNAERPFICRRAQAVQNAAETLRVSGRPQMQADIVVRRELGRTILAGDYVLLDVDLEPNVSSIYQFFRVTQRTVPLTGPIKFNLLADNTLAPIVWQGPTPPVIRTQFTVEPITNVRLLQGTYALTGRNCAMIALAQRPDAMITGFHLYFDTDSGGTFSSMLGAQTVFAGRATLSAAVAAADTTLAITVADQMDMERFTSQPGDLAAANDELLAILVSTVPAHDPVTADDGQAAEDGNGYAVLEVCSVSASALLGAGSYSLTVLRGRQNTQAAAWTTANTEVWLVPRSGLVVFTHSEFGVLQGNRQSGATPAYGYFRLTPFTSLAEFELSEATSVKFRFPLKSPAAPNLVLTAPVAANNELVVASPVYPYALQVTGNWLDADANLVSWQMLLQKSTDAAPRLIAEAVFTGTARADFDETVGLESGGTYWLTLRADDATGFSTRVVITIAATGNGGKVMPPTVTFAGRVLGATEGGCYGLLEASCQTPGAQILWRHILTLTRLPGDSNWNWSIYVDQATTPAMHLPPFLNDSSWGSSAIMPYTQWQFIARVAGMDDSDPTTITFSELTLYA
jgi:hypothetical protein